MEILFIIAKTGNNPTGKPPSNENDHSTATHPNMDTL
jgi:hypothetical protein